MRFRFGKGTVSVVLSLHFFFNDTATTEIYTLSLHDALPILTCWPKASPRSRWRITPTCGAPRWWTASTNSTPTSSVSDRKSTRLNSSHQIISYAVFCLKKKKKQPALTHALIKQLYDCDRQRV